MVDRYTVSLTGSPSSRAKQGEGIFPALLHYEYFAYCFSFGKNDTVGAKSVIYFSCK